MSLEQLSDVVKNKSLFLLDGDGTLYVGSRSTPMASSFIRLLMELKKKFLIMTNNSSYSRYQHAKRIGHILRLKIKIDNVLVSTQPTIKYLLEHKIKTVYVLGMPSFINEIKAAGIEIDRNNPDMVVIAFDRRLTYAKLANSVKLILRGIPYIVTHPDVLCPVNNGYIPDTGSLLSLIESATKRYPLEILGKPNKAMLDYAFDITGENPGTTVLFGDRLYTDIKMAKSYGVTSVLVLTGETKGLENSELKPDYVLKSFKELVQTIKRDL